MRMPLACLALVAATLTLASAARAQEASGTYKIDPGHASVAFKVEHMGLADIHGRFNEFSGEIDLGQDPSIDVTIQTGSVDTAVPKRDEHLRSPDFFDARQYPQITFKSTSIERTGETLNVTGDFTMHGQTREVTIPLTLKGPVEFQGKEKIGLTGETTIDRREWGLDAWQGMVGNDVTLMISVEATE